MIKISTLIILLLGWNALVNNVSAQANPSAGILPLNPGGIVALGAIQDVKVSIANTLSGNIIAFKLRPIITIPANCTVLPDAQQTGLPPGWVIVTNTPATGQIRVCNGTDVIGGFQNRDVIIKVQGTTIGGPAPCAVQINYGGASCAVSGPQPTGNLPADDAASSSLTVVAGCSLGVSATAGIINCNGGTTGITALATNAPGPVEYSLTGAAPFQSSNVFNNISSGTYFVTAREIANPTTCVAVSTPIIINDPALIPAPVLSIIQPTCTVSSGSATLTSTVTGLTFSIDGGPFSAYPAGGYLLPTGSHTITAKNINDCISPTTTFTIDAQPSSPSTPAIGPITQPTCTISTGSVVLNNLPAGEWTIEPGSIAGNTTTATVNNLAAGSYSFTVTNAAGCSSIPSANVVINAVVGAPDEPLVTILQPTCTIATGTIIVTSPTIGFTFSVDGGAFATYPAGGFTGIVSGTHTLTAQNLSGCTSPVTNITINTQPTAPPAPTVSVVQPSCTVSTGTITVSSTTTGLTFSLDAGPFTPYPVAGYTTAPGIHSLAVQNGSGCTPTVTNNIVVNAQPASPSLSSVFTPITCFADSSIITATASGGNLPYTYSINAGAFQNANVFTVGAGSYTIAVKDSNGCTAVSSSLTITEPAKILATITSTAIACVGGNSTITVLASGGIGPFEYRLNNGAYQTGNIFNVVAGTYSVNVREISNPNCSATTTSVTVSQPAILKATSSAAPIYYCGGSTVVKVAATGGTIPYTGTGDFVRGPGKWSFIVSDAKGCTSSTEVIIVPPGCVDLKVSPNPAQNLITVNHSPALSASAIQIYATNGAMVLYKSIPQNAFISTLNVSALAGGNYLLIFTNGNEQKEVRFIKTNQ